MKRREVEMMGLVRETGQASPLRVQVQPGVDETAYVSYDARDSPLFAALPVELHLPRSSGTSSAVPSALLPSVVSSLAPADEAATFGVTIATARSDDVIDAPVSLPGEMQAPLVNEPTLPAEVDPPSAAASARGSKSQLGSGVASTILAQQPSVTASRASSSGSSISKPSARKPSESSVRPTVSVESITDVKAVKAITRADSGWHAPSTPILDVARLSPSSQRRRLSSLYAQSGDLLFQDARNSLKSTSGEPAAADASLPITSSFDAPDSATDLPSPLSSLASLHASLAAGSADVKPSRSGGRRLSEYIIFDSASRLDMNAAPIVEHLQSSPSMNLLVSPKEPVSVASPTASNAAPVALPVDDALLLSPVKVEVLDAMSSVAEISSASNIQGITDAAIVASDTDGAAGSSMLSLSSGDVLLGAPVHASATASRLLSIPSLDMSHLSAAHDDVPLVDDAILPTPLSVMVVGSTTPAAAGLQAQPQPAALKVASSPPEADDAQHHVDILFDATSGPGRSSRRRQSRSGSAARGDRRRSSGLRSLTHEPGFEPAASPTELASLLHVSSSGPLPERIRPPSAIRLAAPPRSSRSRGTTGLLDGGVGFTKDEAPLVVLGARPPSSRDTNRGNASTSITSDVDTSHVMSGSMFSEPVGGVELTSAVQPSSRRSASGGPHEPAVEAWDRFTSTY